MTLRLSALANPGPRLARMLHSIAVSSLYAPLDNGQHDDASQAYRATRERARQQEVPQRLAGLAGSRHDAVGHDHVRSYSGRFDRTVYHGPVTSRFAMPSSGNVVGAPKAREPHSAKLLNTRQKRIAMAAYAISEVEIVNEDAANRYKQLAADSIAAYGGRYLARAAEAVVVEGEPTRRRIVIVEFPSMQQLRKWYASPEYAEALKYRHAALERRLMFVEGQDSSA